MLLTLLFIYILLIHTYIYIMHVYNTYMFCTDFNQNQFIHQMSISFDRFFLNLTNEMRYTITFVEIKIYLQMPSDSIEQQDLKYIWNNEMCEIRTVRTIKMTAGFLFHSSFQVIFHRLLMFRTRIHTYDPTYTHTYIQHSHNIHTYTQYLPSHIQPRT